MYNRLLKIKSGTGCHSMRELKDLFGAEVETHLSAWKPLTLLAAAVYHTTS